MRRNLEKVMQDLEAEEIESPKGVASAAGYAQLLALYLYENELCHAKYLWKRIPNYVKTSNTELNNIWSIGQKMWKRDWEGIHSALDHTWSKNVDDIMSALKDRIRERAVNLISEAYSSLDVATMSKMTGLTSEQAMQLAVEKEWNVNGNVIRPVRVVKKQNIDFTETNTEEQLYKLTQFVSFLEN